jgi:hypothetical protein
MIAGLQPHMHSVPITNEVGCSNHAHVIKVVNKLQYFGGFLWVLTISSTIEKNITEILLKVALNTITLILWGCHFPSLPERFITAD